MEDIPNKVRDILGIIVDVNLLTQDGKDYIEICVNPSSYPVNYKGEYHYRSGSTKQLLRGAALTEFLLSKTGYKWDAVPVDGVTVDDLDKESFDIFRREALRSGRMTEEDLNMSNEQQFSCFTEIRKSGLQVHISKSDILVRDLICVIRMRFMALCLFRRTGL